MNKVTLVGRLTKDAELKFAAGTGSAVAKFGIAVNRRFKKAGQPTADFLNVTVFGKTAEAVANYTQKGSLVSISGSIQTGSYVNKAGDKVYTTYILAEEVNFLDKKGDRDNSSGQSSQGNSYSSDVTPIEDGDIPF